MKRKLILIIGIILVLAGVGIFSYPIVKQAISASEQQKIMEDVKAQILANLNEVKSNDSSESDKKEPDPSLAIDPDEQEADYFQQLELDFTEVPTTETSVLDSDRLKGHSPYGIIEIEKIDLIYAIVEGVDSWNIGVAIGHFPSSVDFGQEGNCALAGHRGGTSGPYFRDIDELEKGDKVKVTGLDGAEYTYTVTGSMIVEPTDTYVVKNLGKEGKYLTLVTCTNGGKQRLIVRCQIEE